MGQPAARVTDMQTCPMVTGIVPHVGGPITLGCFTVLVGAMPQARITDMHTCVGPPGVDRPGFVHSLGRGYAGLPRRRFNGARRCRRWAGRAHRSDWVSRDDPHLDRPAMPADRRAGGATGDRRRVLDWPRSRQPVGAARPDEAPVEAALRPRLSQRHLAGGRNQHQRHICQPRRGAARIPRRRIRWWTATG